MSYRQMLVCEDLADAISALENVDSGRVLSQFQSAKDRPVIFMFPGGGAQYNGMATELYKNEQSFREQINICAKLLKPSLGFYLSDKLYGNDNQNDETVRPLTNTSIALPALFTVEYALAKMLMSWGIYPQAMIGHSLGEYVAACLSGVFSLEDALSLVLLRGRLFELLPSGGMLSIPLSEKELLPLLDNELSIAAINAPSLCTISGSIKAIEEMQRRLRENGIDSQRIHIDVAAHSPMITPILGEFRRFVEKIELRPPLIPFISNISGNWITAKEATDANYWVNHLRQTVRFADGIGELIKDPDRIFLEVGPGKTLETVVKHQLCKDTEQAVFSLIRHPYDKVSDEAFLLNTLGRLWLAGTRIDWAGFYTAEKRQRIPLPTYPFERQRYWVEPEKQPRLIEQSRLSLGKKPDVADWFYIPSWKRSVPPLLFERKDQFDEKSCCLIFADQTGLGIRIAEKLEQQGHCIVVVMAGAEFSRLSDHKYVVNPTQREDYIALIKELYHLDKRLEMVAHLWSVTSPNERASEVERFSEAQRLGLHSLIYLVQALGEENFTGQLQLQVVSSNMQRVAGEKLFSPEKATLLGPCRVIPQEYPNIACRSIDILLPETIDEEARLIDQLAGEFYLQSTDRVLAYRDYDRWVQTFEAVQLNGVARKPMKLREKGVYLITGGLGGVGLILAEHLVKVAKARLVLLGRSTFPARSEWEQILAISDQNSLSEKIRRLIALEEMGAEILVISADVTDYRQMQAVVAEISQQFGEIHGVIHAAGVPGGGIIQLKSTAEIDSTLATKTLGTLTLYSIFKEKRLDFLMLCSSLAALVGGIGRCDYCAANAFLDLFADQNSARRNVPMVAVNWDTWQDVGMAIEAARPFENILGVGIKNGLTSEESIAVFDRILSSELPHVIVSTQDFQVITAHYNSSLLSSHTKPSLTPSHSRPLLTSLYTGPRTEQEQVLTNIWQTLLGVEQIGVNDNFFELGGHSLLAIQVASRIRAEFNIELSPRQMFEAPTIAELTEIVTQSRLQQKEHIVSTIKPVVRDGELPLSFAQQRLWFIDQLEPNRSLYNIPMALRLNGKLDISALELTLSEIIRRHESLRTSFPTVNGQVSQSVSAPQPISLRIIDLSTLNDDKRESQALDIAVKEANRPFNLAQGPLFRSMLLRLYAQQHVLLVVMHHIITDGWSMGIFIRELTVLYKAFSTGNPSPLQELPIQYVDYAVWQRQWLQADILEQQLNYWRQQLEGVPQLLKLPTDYPRPTIATHNGARQNLFLGKQLSDRLKSLCRQEDITLFMLLLAAFQTLLYRYSGQERIVVGVDVANRNRAEMEGLIGFFINMLAMNVDLSGNPSFRTLLGRVREVALGAYAHQDLPFEKLVEELHPERELNRSPLFQVAFVLQNTPVQAIESSEGLVINNQVIDTQMSPYDLVFSLAQTSDDVLAVMWYSSDLFEALTIARLLQHYQLLLEGVVALPDTSITNLPILTEEEKYQLLTVWNGTCLDFEKQVCVHQLFEIQSEQTPNAIAVTFEQQELSYRELNMRANQLAHYLQTLGVGPEVVVGICLERSIEMVVAVLGILKAGGVFAPLDANYPLERLTYMLEDAQMSILLSQNRLIEKLPTYWAQVICLDSEWEIISEQPNQSPQSSVSAHNSVYVIYTSGSTGTPKGVVVEHQGLSNLVKMQRDTFQLCPGSKVLQFASLSFDASVWEIFMALLSGSTL
ncbi:MAG: SDR family NAD(P)-dependent oxidoreductase, partial [Acidobacteriota bacterium]